MAVKIRLKRMGKIRAPYYRIVVANSRTKRDGKTIEEIGKYHPKADPSFIEVDSERCQHWLSVGAQPTEPVLAILNKTGDWQKYKGLPAPEPLLEPKVKADRRARFDEALREAHAEPDSEAVSKRSRKPKDDAKAGKAEKPDKTEKAGKAEKPDKSEKAGKAEKPDKSEKPDKADKAENKSEPEQADKPDAEAQAAESEG